jgi:hypothetical protein
MIVGRSVEVTSDSQVVTGTGRIGAVVVTPAAAVATLVLHDNTSATGTVLLSLQAAANGGSVVFDTPIAFSVGVYANIGGAGAAAYVVLV